MLYSQNNVKEKKRKKKLLAEFFFFLRNKHLKIYLGKWYNLKGGMCYICL